MANPEDLKALARDLDVATTWIGGTRSVVMKGLADRAWELAGGREPLSSADPNRPTPGPGVRQVEDTQAEQAAVATPTAPVVVDSVGNIGNKPKDNPPA